MLDFQFTQTPHDKFDAWRKNNEYLLGSGTLKTNSRHLLITTLLAAAAIGVLLIPGYGWGLLLADIMAILYLVYYAFGLLKIMAFKYCPTLVNALFRRFTPTLTINTSLKPEKIAFTSQRGRKAITRSIMADDLTHVLWDDESVYLRGKFFGFVRIPLQAMSPTLTMDDILQLLKQHSPRVNILPANG